MVPVDEKVTNILKKNRDSGVSANNIARLARIDKEVVYRTIYRLRNDFGLKINLDRRVVRGKKINYYKLAG